MPPTDTDRQSADLVHRDVSDDPSGLSLWDRGALDVGRSTNEVSSVEKSHDFDCFEAEESDDEALEENPW